MENQCGNTALKWHMRQDGLDRYILEHPTRKEQNTHSSQAAEHSPGQITLGHNTSLNKWKSEIVSGIFSDHHGVKPKTSYRKTLQTRGD